MVLMTEMLDLFGAPPVSGLKTAADFLSVAEEAEMIARVNASELTPFRFHQWIGKRLTHSFGWSHDFGSGSFAPAHPIPDWLQPLQARAACFAGLRPEDLVQALLIRYDPGASIGWHKDRPVFEDVVGISMGTPAVLRLRRRTASGFERAKAELTPRSIYYLSGEVRHAWEHSIAPLETPRWSITFRSLSTKGDSIRHRK